MYTCLPRAICFHLVYVHLFAARNTPQPSTTKVPPIVNDPSTDNNTQMPLPLMASGLEHKIAIAGNPALCIGLRNCGYPIVSFPSALWHPAQEPGKVAQSLELLEIVVWEIYTFGVRKERRVSDFKSMDAVGHFVQMVSIAPDYSRKAGW